MILDFETIDIYPENHLRVLFEKFHQPPADIVRDYLLENEDDSNVTVAGTSAQIRQLRKHKPHGNSRGKSINPREGMRLKSLYSLSKLAIWAQHKRNWRLMGGRITIMDPRFMREIFASRNLDHIDYVMGHKDLYSDSDKQKYSAIIRGTTAPTLEEVVEITEYIREFDRGLVEVPLDPGIRFDIDDWSEYPNLRPKESWEEESD